MQALLTTSVSLPDTVAALWRHNQGAILKLAIRTLRVQMRKIPVRRAVKRHYNSSDAEFTIVTTRFTEAEYDTLHFVAHSLRVSVSYLVSKMIEMWLKPSRRTKANARVTNYEIFLTNWGANSGIITECLIFWPKLDAQRIIRNRQKHSLPI